MSISTALAVRASLVGIIRGAMEVVIARRAPSLLEPLKDPFHVALIHDGDKPVIRDAPLLIDG
jgi:hypothetical protein